MECARSKAHSRDSPPRARTRAVKVPCRTHRDEHTGARVPARHPARKLLAEHARCSCRCRGRAATLGRTGGSPARRHDLYRALERQCRAAFSRKSVSDQTHMPRDQDIPQWIPHLADPEPSERARFAERLYRAASDRCLPLLNQWKTDPEFRQLLCTRNPPELNDTDAEPAVMVAGIAVKPDQFEKIRAANNSPRLADVPPDQDAKEFELHFANQVALDILTSGDRSGSGAIARFLEKFGEGIQQVEVYVRNVDRTTR